MQAIGANEVAPDSLFVGGCVRNALMKIPVHDIDVATRLMPEEVTHRLEHAGIKVIPTGLRHGTVTAIIEGKTFEITSLRRDVQTDGRHAVIAYTDDWVEDALRRDFTMNTLLASPKGEVYDPTGRGIADLEKKSVVFVGDPVKRIEEDHLRILRFFRFFGFYGAPPVDLAALSACRAGADLLQTLSKERITQEVFKILSLPRPGMVWMLMNENGILRGITSDHVNAQTLDQLSALQSLYERVDVLTRLMLIAHDKIKCLEQYLIFSNAQKQQMQLTGNALIKMEQHSSEKVLRECIYRFGNMPSLQAYFLLKSLRNEDGRANDIDVLRFWRAPVFPVTGDDLIKKGQAQGPELGRVLKSMEEEWIASDFKKLP